MGWIVEIRDGVNMFTNRKGDQIETRRGAISEALFITMHTFIGPRPYASEFHVSVVNV